MNRGFFSVILSLTVFLSLGCGGHGGGSTGDATIELVGNAFFPGQVFASKTAVANSPFIVVDFVKAADKQTVASGVTDSAGAYDVVITQSKVIAVIVSGQPSSSTTVRVSGLISADPSDIEKSGLIGKDFDGITDVACEAGVTAIVQGAVLGQDFSSERIANLEAAAALVEPDVNHFDPASVTAGAARVRALTDDGAHPPR